MAISVERSTAVAGQEHDGCQFRRIHGVLGSWKLNGPSSNRHLVFLLLVGDPSQARTSRSLSSERLTI